MANSSGDRRANDDRSTPLPAGKTVSNAFDTRFEHVCLAFEEAWNVGRQPRLEDYLRATVKPDRSALLKALLLIELVYRRRFGQQPTEQEYRVRFADDCESVVSAFRRATDFTTWRASTPEHDEPVATPATLPAGSRLGRYRVERMLGSGTFGDVYLAHDEQLDRRVAIKIPRRGRFTSEASVDQFLQEARTAAQMAHPAIVPVHDVGRSDDGRPFIVMQYIPGPTLRERLHGEALPFVKAAELVLRIAEGLHFAHQRGIVHRDLKPGNILLDAQGQPLVADFGLATHESVLREHPGEFSGTLPYMAPEQVRRESHWLDGRTDVWAMGVMLYELLTGRRPFLGKNDVEVADEIEHREPKPPRQIDDRIPVELERICLRALAKPLAQRYATAADLAADLRRWLRPAPRTGRWAMAGGVGMAILLTALAVHWYWLATVARWAPVHTQIDVFVWSPTDPARQGLSVRDPAALPLRPGDQFRVEAKLDRPMHVYLLWIDDRGQVQPLYPWTPGRWEIPKGADTPRRQVSLPAHPDRGWPLEGGPGMETILMLARESPLPHDLDLHQAVQDSQLPTKSTVGSSAFAEYEHGRPVPGAQKPERPPIAVEGSEDPADRSQVLLAQKLGPQFPVLRAVSFASGSVNSSPKAN